jgi:hypothetical protein
MILNLLKRLFCVHEKRQVKEVVVADGHGMPDMTCPAIVCIDCGAILAYTNSVQ